MNRSRGEIRQHEVVTRAQGDEAALVARIAGRDRDAFEQLYRLHAPWLLTRLESRCGDPDLADLALQDTFLAVWKSARRFRGDGDVGAWLWGIGIRRLIDQLRKRREVPIDPALIAFDRASPLDTEALVIGGVRADLDQAMFALSPELRAVLVATAIDGLSTREAAHLLGVPQGTVKTRLMRARRQLQEAIP